MINSIIEAISAALNQEFGDGCEIHMEEIKQGLKEPCFFIFCLNPVSDQFLGKRYFRSSPFCIQYFPESDEKQRECSSVAERMLGCLEYITTNGDDKPIMGTKMKYEVADGILSFFVNFDLFVYKAAGPVPAMEEVIKETSVKG